MNEIRIWHGYAFSFIASITPERDSEGRIVEFMPQDRYAKRANSKLHPYGAGPFCRFGIGWGYPIPGVYVITAEEHLAYVGKCGSLSERFNSRGYGSIQPKNCYGGGQRTNCRINNLILQAAQRERELRVWLHETDADRERIESELIRTLRPPWNMQLIGR